jgi:hypothetical protein
MASEDLEERVKELERRLSYIEVDIAFRLPGRGREEPITTTCAPTVRPPLPWSADPGGVALVFHAPGFEPGMYQNGVRIDCPTPPPSPPPVHVYIPNRPRSALEWADDHLPADDPPPVNVLTPHTGWPTPQEAEDVQETCDTVVQEKESV